MNSAELFARANKVTPGGVHSPVRAFNGVNGTPIFFQQAEGAWLTSVEGDRYIDFCQSFGPLILGHRDPTVTAAVEAMLQRVWTLGACEPYSLELAEWIVARVPWVEQLRFVSSGTEAVMSALRVARGATGRNKIIKFSGCYHGHSDALLVDAGSGLAGTATSSSAGVSDALVADTLVAPLDDEAAVEQIFQQHGADIAALIIEPLPANNGLLPQRQAFLQTLADLCQQYGSLLIFDEVISGFRVGIGGMAEQLGIEPDLVTYGKIIGGGFPVGAYGGKRQWLEQVAPVGQVYQAGTLSANPVGMAAGLATLQKLEREAVNQQLANSAEQFCQQLNNELQTAGINLALSHYSSLLWFHPADQATIRRSEDVRPSFVAFYQRFFHHCLQQGIYLAPSAYEVAFLSLAHTPDILQQAIQGFVAAARSADAEA